MSAEDVRIVLAVLVAGMNLVTRLKAAEARLAEIERKRAE